MYCLCVNVYCTLPPGDNPITVNKYIIYQISEKLNDMSLVTKPHLSLSWRQKFPLKFQCTSKRTHCITFQEILFSWKTPTWRTSQLIIMRCDKRGNARSPNHSWRGKAISITYSECVCVYAVLVIHNVKLLRLTVLSSVTCLSLPHFPTLSHKRYYFGKKVIEHKMCVLIFSTTVTGNNSCFKKKWARCDYKWILVFM